MILYLSRLIVFTYCIYYLEITVLISLKASLYGRNKSHSRASGSWKTDQIWCFSDAAGQKKVKTLFLSEIFDFLKSDSTFWQGEGKIDPKLPSTSPIQGFWRKNEGKVAKKWGKPPKNVPGHPYGCPGTFLGHYGGPLQLLPIFPFKMTHFSFKILIGGPFWVILDSLSLPLVKMTGQP